MTWYLGIKNNKIISAERDKKQVEDAQIIYGYSFDEIKEISEEEHKFDYIQGYDGYFYLKENVPSIPIDILKTNKRAEINQARDNAEQGGFEYLGKMFDSDQVSCQRISCAAQAMALAPEGSTITWTCQDNSTIDLTASELVGLVVALAQWSNTCHQKATILKEQIELAETEEELEKIQWNAED